MPAPQSSGATNVNGTRSSLSPVSRSHLLAASMPRRQYAPSGSMTRRRTNCARAAGVAFLAEAQHPRRRGAHRWNDVLLLDLLADVVLARLVPTQPADLAVAFGGRAAVAQPGIRARASIV
ncbi:hypothetical protein SGRIM119S_07620 [Streptomyces griseorubiginosus]